MSSTGKICIVAPKLLSRTGDLEGGECPYEIAEALVSIGWEVHVLCIAASIDSQDLAYAQTRLDIGSVRLHLLRQHPRSLRDSLTNQDMPSDGHSMHVLSALMKLQEQFRFDLIEFEERDGFAFRTVQARQMGTGLLDVELVVRLSGPRQWRRHADRQWPEGLHLSIPDYFEQYAFEKADHQISCSAELLDTVKSFGWDFEPGLETIDSLIPKQRLDIRRVEVTQPELVFLGSLGVKEGLLPFLEAMKRLPSDVPVSFLGRDTVINHSPASSLIRSEIGRRPCHCRDAGSAEEVMQYLASPNRIAVLPHVDQCDPHLAMQCIVNGVPMLASNIGVHRRLIANQAIRQTLLFEPTPKDIQRCCEQYLRFDHAKRVDLVIQTRDGLDASKRIEKLGQRYGEIFDRRSDRVSTAISRLAAIRVTAEPLVSVVVPYYNLPDYLPETLESLKSQDYKSMEVIVVNDGSTTNAGKEVFEQMKFRYPDFRFIEHVNQGLGATRNRGLQESSGQYFLPVDADNIAMPNMVRQFVNAMQRRPQLAAASCLFTAFRQTTDIENQTFAYAYRPYGGPFVAAAAHNVYGDANSIFRRDALVEVGGYSIDRDTTCEDWELFVKMVGRGYEVDTIPEYLFHYRHRDGSMLRTTDAFLNRSRVLRQFFETDQLSPKDRVVLWTALVGAHEASAIPAKVRRLGQRRRRSWVAAEMNRVIKRFSNGQPLISTRSRRRKQAA